MVKWGLTSSKLHFGSEVNIVKNLFYKTVFYFIVFIMGGIFWKSEAVQVEISKFG